MRGIAIRHRLKRRTRAQLKMPFSVTKKTLGLQVHPFRGDAYGFQVESAVFSRPAVFRDATLRTAKHSLICGRRDFVAANASTRGTGELRSGQAEPNRHGDRRIEPNHETGAIRFGLGLLRQQLTCTISSSVQGSASVASVLLVFGNLLPVA